MGWVCRGRAAELGGEEVVRREGAGVGNVAKVSLLSEQLPQAAERPTTYVDSRLM